MGKNLLHSILSYYRKIHWKISDCFEKKMYLCEINCSTNITYKILILCIINFKNTLKKN